MASKPSSNFNNFDTEKIGFAALIRPFDVFEEIQTNIQRTIKTKRSYANMPIEIEFASGEKRVFDVSCSYMEQGNSSGNI